jgi:hypothetical protein
MRKRISASRPPDCDEAGLAIFSELSKSLDVKLMELERFQSGAVAKIYEMA